jgi:hypothetical protein
VGGGAERLPLYLPTFLHRACNFALFFKILPTHTVSCAAPSATNKLDGLSHTRNSTPASPMKSEERLCSPSYQEDLLCRKEEIEEKISIYACVRQKTSGSFKSKISFHTSKFSIIEPEEFENSNPGRKQLLGMPTTAQMEKIEICFFYSSKDTLLGLDIPVQSRRLHRGEMVCTKSTFQLYHRKCSSYQVPISRLNQPFGLIDASTTIKEVHFASNALS